MTLEPARPVETVSSRPRQLSEFAPSCDKVMTTSAPKPSVACASALFAGKSHRRSTRRKSNRRGQALSVIVYRSPRVREACGAKGIRTPDPTLPGPGRGREQALYLLWSFVVGVVRRATVVSVVVNTVAPFRFRIAAPA